MCPDLYEPVCGNDGSTYPSRCVLGLEACDNNDQLRALHAGECATPATGKPMNIDSVANTAAKPRNWATVDPGAVGKKVGATVS